MRFGDKRWHSSLQNPLGSFRLRMVLSELLIQLNIWCLPRMLWGRCQSKLHYLFNSDPPTFFSKQSFWLSNCCSWKIGNVPGQKSAWFCQNRAVSWAGSQVWCSPGVPVTPCMPSAYTEGPSPPRCQLTVGHLRSNTQPPGSTWEAGPANRAVTEMNCWTLQKFNLKLICTQRSHSMDESKKCEVCDNTD